MREGEIERQSIPCFCEMSMTAFGWNRKATKNTVAFSCHLIMVTYDGRRGVDQQIAVSNLDTKYVCSSSYFLL